MMQVKENDRYLLKDMPVYKETRIHKQQSLAAVYLLNHELAVYIMVSHVLFQVVAHLHGSMKRSKYTSDDKNILSHWNG